MADHSAEHAEHQDHILPISTYVFVFLFLMVMTALTVIVAKIDLGIFNTLVALAIAGAKATAVILFFMHVKFATKLQKLFVVGGFFWLLLMFLLVMMDYLNRLHLGTALF